MFCVTSFLSYSQSNEFQKSISDFKSVVTSCGSVYGHIQDFVDYAALAFVPDPTILPNFKALISVSHVSVLCCCLNLLTVCNCVTAHVQGVGLPPPSTQCSDQKCCQPVAPFKYLN